MSRPVMRLLGVAARDDLDVLQAAMLAVPGTDVGVRIGGEVGALWQQEPAVPLLRRGTAPLATGLHVVRRRIELACRVAPFLAADPAAALCAWATLAGLLDANWGALAAALARHGEDRQWDVAMRCQDDVAGGPARCEALLRAALAPAAATLVATMVATGAGAANERRFAVLCRADCGAAVPAAADLVATAIDGLTIELRGPLPPLSFAAVRLAKVAARGAASVRYRLDLPLAVAVTPLSTLPARAQALA